MTADQVENVKQLIERLQLLVIPLDGQQWQAMLDSGKWFKAKAMYDRLQGLGQLPGWYTYEAFTELLKDYHRDMVQYQVRDSNDGLLVRAYGWREEKNKKYLKQFGQ